MPNLAPFRTALPLLCLAFALACTPAGTGGDDPGDTHDTDGGTNPPPPPPPPSGKVMVRVEGGGSVESIPAGLFCTDGCEASFPEDAHVRLVAKAAPGTIFRRWEGACMPWSPVVSVTAQGEVSCKAVFAPDEGPRRLRAFVAGEGTIKSSTKGIDCGEDCAEDAADGTAITLTAKAGRGWKFAGWRGDCAGTDASATVTLLGDTTCVAEFTGGGVEVWPGWSLVRHSDPVVGVQDAPLTGGLFSVVSQMQSYLWSADGRFHRRIGGWNGTLSPDERTVASNGWRTQLSLWDAATGGLVAEASPLADNDGGGFRAIAWAPDSRSIATGESTLEGRIVRIWDLELNELKRSADRIGYVNALRFTGDGTGVIAVSDGPRSVTRVKVSDGSIEWETFPTDEPWNLAVHDASHQVLVATARGFVLLDTRTGEELGNRRNVDDGLAAVSWKPDGTQFATAWVNGYVGVYSTESLLEERALEVSGGAVSDVQWSADGQRILAALRHERSVKVLDVAKREVIAHVAPHSAEFVSGAYSSDGKFFALTAEASSAPEYAPEPGLRVFDVATGAVVFEAGPGENGRHLGWQPGTHVLLVDLEGSGFSATAFDLDTKQTVDAPRVYSYSEIRWRPDGGEVAHLGSTSLNLSKPGEWESRELEPAWGLGAIAWSPDGTRLAGAGRDGIVIWNAESGEVEKQWDREDTSDLHHLAWPPAGGQLVTGDNSGDVAFWDIATGTQLRTMETYGFAFSPDGRWMLAETGILDAVTGTPTRTFPGWYFSPEVDAWRADGKGFVLQSSSEVRLMNARW